MKMIRICVAVLLIAFLGCAQGCVTEEKITLIDTTVTNLIGQLIIAGQITVSPEAALSGTVTDLLNALCDTPAIKAPLVTLQTEISQCNQLLINATSLQVLNIQGVALDTLFTDFDDVDHFCLCRTDLAAAWALKSMAVNFKHENPDSIYNTTANVELICSSLETKGIIAALASSSANCSTPVEKQAGVTSQEEKEKFERLGKLTLATLCASYSASVWNCTDQYAKQSFAHHCLSWAASLSQDKVPCGKQTCISTFDGHCGAGASDLYINAVNVENPGALLETGDTCTSHTDLTCVDYDKLTRVNTAAQTIDGGLANYVDSSSGTPVIQDSDIPTILSTLCTNLTAAMTEIHTEVTSCGNLALLATSLESLTIKDVSFAEFFDMFTDVNTFCGCIGDIPKSWQLKDSAASHVYSEPLAAYTNIADVENICGNTLKGLFEGIAGSSTECKEALQALAGFSDSDNKEFDDIYDIAEGCDDSTDVAADWTCMTEAAKTSGFKTCINDEGNKLGDRALCGKWECVSQEMNECSSNARKLYIKAVNIENSDDIRETGDGCDGACVLNFSLLAIVACFLLSYTYK